MNFSVMVHTVHGQFEAALVGAPEVRATAPTRADALAALESVIEKRVQQGELVTLEIGRKGLAGLFGFAGTVGVFSVVSACPSKFLMLLRKNRQLLQ